MHQLAARELAIAKKCSSCGDMNYTANSSSENEFLKTSCPWSAVQPFVSWVLVAALSWSSCECLQGSEPRVGLRDPCFACRTAPSPMLLCLRRRWGQLSPRLGAPGRFWSSQAPATGQKQEQRLALQKLMLQFSPGCSEGSSCPLGVLQCGGLPLVGRVLQRWVAKVKSKFEA